MIHRTVAPVMRATDNILLIPDRTIERCLVPDANLLVAKVSRMSEAQPDLLDHHLHGPSLEIDHPWHLNVDVTERPARCSDVVAGDTSTLGSGRLVSLVR